MYKFKSVNINTVKGIKYAELLKRKGWKIISVGFYTILLQKEFRKGIK